MSFIGNTTAEETLLIGDSIRIRIKNAITSAALCNEFVERVEYLNVTVLLNPNGRSAIKDLCSGQATFSTISSPGVKDATQPSSSPSGQPTSVPSYQPTLAVHGIVTSGFIGFICIILLIAFLRFHPLVTALFAVKKEESEGHLYDILVVLNEDEEAIVENIRHEDIAFFRRTNVENETQSYTWMMNATSDILEKRFEVQFFDQYDLFGQSGLENKDDNLGHAVLGDKLVTKEVYRHEAKLHMGMIIKVKSLSEQKQQQKQKKIDYDESDAESEFSASISSKDFHDTPESPENLVACSRYSIRSPRKKGRIGVSSESSWTEKDHQGSVGSYDDGISDDESEYASGRNGQTGFSYGLKHEEYHEDSDSEDSVDLTSIDLPLDSFSFSDSNPMMKNAKAIRSNGGSGASSVVDSYEGRDLFADNAVPRPHRQFSRRGSNYSTTSAVSSISSKSVSMNNSSLPFNKPRSSNKSRRNNYRDEELEARDDEVNLADILRASSSSKAHNMGHIENEPPMFGKASGTVINKRAQMGRDLKALTASMATASHNNTKKPDLFGERYYDEESDDSSVESEYKLHDRRQSIASSVMSSPFMLYEDENAESRQI